jgi:hypothetical protein
LTNVSSDLHQAPRDHFQPGACSLWLYDREGRGGSLLLAFNEWEIAGLRGLRLERVWNEMHVADGAISVRPLDDDEIAEFHRADVLQLANLIDTGHMQRVGFLTEPQSSL